MKTRQISHAAVKAFLVWVAVLSLLLSGGVSCTKSTPDTGLFVDHSSALPGQAVFSFLDWEDVRGRYAVESVMMAVSFGDEPTVLNIEEKLDENTGSALFDLEAVLGFPEGSVTINEMCFLVKGEGLAMWNEAWRRTEPFTFGAQDSIEAKVKGSDFLPLAPGE